MLGTIPALRAVTNDSTAIRSVFGACPSPVAALAAVIDGAPVVLVASSFTVGVSLEPPMCMFAVQHTSTTWPVLRRGERIGASILAADQGEIVRQLAGRDHSARLRGVGVTTLESRALLIDNAVAHLECVVAAEHPAGDHDVVILEIVSSATDRSRAPLVFHDSGFHRVAALDHAC